MLGSHASGEDRLPRRIDPGGMRCACGCVAVGAVETPPWPILLHDRDEVLVSTVSTADSSPVPADAAPADRPLVRISHVSKLYGDFRALDDSVYPMADALSYLLWNPRVPIQSTL